MIGLARWLGLGKKKKADTRPIHLESTLGIHGYALIGLRDDGGPSVQQILSDESLEHEIRSERLGEEEVEVFFHKGNRSYVAVCQSSQSRLGVDLKAKKPTWCGYIPEEIDNEQMYRTAWLFVVGEKEKAAGRMFRNLR